MKTFEGLKDRTLLILCKLGVLLSVLLAPITCIIWFATGLNLYKWFLGWTEFFLKEVQEYSEKFYK